MKFVLVSVFFLPFSVCFLEQPPKPAVPTSGIIFSSVTMYVHEGLKTILSCNVIHNRIPMWIDPKQTIINWYDQSSILSTFPDEGRFTVTPDGYLEISYTRPYDAGQYTCQYTDHGKETVGLVVTPPLTTIPTQSSTPGNTIVKVTITLYIHQGQKTILSCSGSNKIPGWTDPNGRLVNYPDESFLNPNYPDQSRVSVSKSGYLVINNTQWTDAGIYTCFYPGHGHQTVTVVVRPPLTTPAPTTTMIPTSKTTHAMIWHISVTLYVHEGQSVPLSCSTPNIIPMWTIPKGTVINLKDSTSINPAIPNSSRFSIDTGGHLVINSIRPSDAGKYVCSYPGQEDETVTVVVGPPLSTSTSSVLTSEASTLLMTSTPSSKTTLKPHHVTATSAPQLASSTRVTSLPTTSDKPRVTSKAPATIPPTSTICAVCAGPVEACEVAFYEEECQPPNHYCMNHITNMADGQKIVERKCGNVTSCYNEWYLGSSDDDKCRALSASSTLNYRFECTFCCIKDGCNVDLHPKADTLYTNT